MKTKIAISVYILIVLVMYLYITVAVANEFMKQANRFNRNIIEQIEMY